MRDEGVPRGPGVPPLSREILSAAAAHDGLRDRRRRRRDLFFDDFLWLAIEDLADELIARLGIFRRTGLGFDGRPLFRSDFLDSHSILLEVVAQPFLHGLQGRVVEHEQDVFRGGAGHDVVNISRGQRSSYLDDPTWQQVRHVTADRAVEDRDGTFPNRVADLQPDVVIDLICFTLDSATALVERLRGETRQLPTAAPSGATAQT